MVLACISLLIESTKNWSKLSSNELARRRASVIHFTYVNVPPAGRCELLIGL